MVTKISDFNLSNFIRYGPPVHYWCMRFEGKHSFFKDLAGRIKNFKNIAKSLAQRHQTWICYYLQLNDLNHPHIRTGTSM